MNLPAQEPYQGSVGVLIRWAPSVLGQGGPLGTHLEVYLI